MHRAITGRLNLETLSAMSVAGSTDYNHPPAAFTETEKLPGREPRPSQYEHRADDADFWFHSDQAHSIYTTPCDADRHAKSAASSIESIKAQHANQSPQSHNSSLKTIDWTGCTISIETHDEDLSPRF